MSQYNSRIYIEVKNENDWKKLSDFDFKKFDFYSNPFSECKNKTFEINGDWACFEDELESLVYEIANKIPDCLILADTTNINVDPYAYIVYYLGSTVEAEDIEGELQWETDLSDPFDWFDQAEISLKKNEVEYLKEFGFEN